MLWSLSAEIAESSPWHDHDLFEFALCRGQGGRFLAENGEIPFHPARTILVPPNTPHRFVFNDGEVGRLKIMCFPPQDPPRFLSPVHVAMLDGLRGMGASVADHVGEEQWLSQLADRIVDGLGVDDAWSLQLHWSAISLLLTLHAKERHAVQDHPGFRHRDKIREIVAWIESNLEKDITIEQAASLFGLSRSLLTREFRRYTGKSFVDYYNARRVQKAAIALVTKPEPVTQVALDSGFSNLSHFHRQFKAYFGLTPAAFRRKVVEQGGL